MKVHCPYDRLVPIKELKAHPKNRNSHPDAQIDRLAKILEYQGWRYPVKVSKLSGYVTSGHGRIEAAKANGWSEVPVSYQEYTDEDQEYSDVQSDNAIAAWAELDLSGINSDLADLGPDFDLDLLGIKDFTLDPSEEDGEGEEGKSLTERFVVPPFSVFDARQGYWQERKRSWLALGIKSEEGRAENLLNFSKTVAKASGTSIFDPVLCEIAYRWFSPKGGVVLDPFAGGSVRGVVASKLGRQYVGIELRSEQVQANRIQAQEICSDPMPVWHNGDSCRLDEIAADLEADLIFSCPPYADLEVYSSDPRDLSTMGYGDFRQSYAEIIKKAVARLKDNRFAFFVVSEIREKKGAGFYQNFVLDTVEAFEAAGARYYNEAILLNAIPSAAMRVSSIFPVARKLVRTHQNVLIFCKGDPKIATQACGEVDLPSEKELGVAASE